MSSRSTRILRKSWSAISRLCYDRGLAAGSGGNLSARVPGSDAHPGDGQRRGPAGRGPRRTSSPWTLEERVLEAPGGPEAFQGDRLPPGGLRRRPEVNAVIHVHPAHAIVLASRGTRDSPRDDLRAAEAQAGADRRRTRRPGSRELCDLVARATEEAGPRHRSSSWRATAWFPSDASLVRRLRRRGACLGNRAGCPAHWKSAAGVLPRIDAGPEIVDLSVPLSDGHGASTPRTPPSGRPRTLTFPRGGVLVSKIETGAAHRDACGRPTARAPGERPVDFRPAAARVPRRRPLRSSSPKRPGEDIEPAGLRGPRTSGRTTS